MYNNISSWLRWNWHLSGCVDFWQTDIRTNELKDWRQTVSSRYLDDWTRKYVIHQVILLLLSYLVEQSLAFESIVMSKQSGCFSSSSKLSAEWRNVRDSWGYRNWTSSFCRGIKYQQNGYLLRMLDQSYTQLATRT